MEKLEHTTSPVRPANYDASPETREFWKTKIDRMLIENIIEPAQNEWAFPIVLVSKKDATFHLFVDY